MQLSSRHGRKPLKQQPLLTAQNSRLIKQLPVQRPILNRNASGLNVQPTGQSTSIRSTSTR